jgi:hypothetical protein
VVVVLVVLIVGAVLLYPAWSARHGKHARWVIEHAANTLVDYDADRLLVAGGNDHAVLDRATGATRTSWFGTAESRGALVPGGIVGSDIGKLWMEPDGEAPGWEKAGVAEEYTLVAVRDDVVVAAVKRDRDYTLTGFALADGTQVWTMPNLERVGFVEMGTEPARPPGALRTTRLIPVVRANAPGWTLVDSGSGAVVATTPEGAVPVAMGPTALSASTTCADLSFAGMGGAVTWPDPPGGDCSPVWAFDDHRVLLIASRDGTELIGGDQAVRLFSVALDTGKATELDWRGRYVDVIDAGERELAQSWGRYLFSRGTVYDTSTGTARWHADNAWINGDTAVVAGPVTGMDRLASGAAEDDRWLRVADAATGEPTGDKLITDGSIYGAYVLDRGQALVFAGTEVALLSR